MFSTSYLGTLFALNYSTINIKNKIENVYKKLVAKIRCGTG
jgi:hypothetical protein